MLVGFDGVAQGYAIVLGHVTAYFLAKLSRASENLSALDFIVVVDFFVVNEPDLESRVKMRSTTADAGRDLASRMLTNWPVWLLRPITVADFGVREDFALLIN